MTPRDDTESHPSGYLRTIRPSVQPAAGTAYLLVIEDGSSRTVALPVVGAVTIGRAPESTLRLKHPSISRLHATIRVEGDAMRVVDAESHNGTRVNGELLIGSRALHGGDVVALGEVVLVVHAAGAGHSSHALDEAAWVRRAVEEVERALTYRRTLVVLAAAGIARERTGDAIAAARDVLRGIDIVGAADDGHVLVACPELGVDDARDVAATLAARLGGGFADARVGYAMCPHDAADAGTLVATARAVARQIEPGAVRRPDEVVTRRKLGDRTIVLAAPAMLRVFALIDRLAAADIPVLIHGETGVGKEHAAYAVHHGSARRDKPFVAINCAALPETLVESEVFGYQKGAFSGAAANTPGLLETAAGGTVFLDEVGELSPAVQAKLLRALETRRITRVGDRAEREVDFRLVAATHRDLEREATEGRFRQDLYFRLGATVVLPPLRDRRAEIPILANEFLAQACSRLARDAMELSPDAMRALLTYDWPGNVRELRNAIEYVVAAIDAAVVSASHLPERIRGGASPSVSAAAAARSSIDAPVDAAVVEPGPGGFGNLADEVRTLERRRMVEALAAAGGVKSRAAELIGMPLRTFRFKAKQFGIE